MTFFPEKIFIFWPKISDDLFFSHRPGFSDFTFLSSPENHYFKKEFLYKIFFFTLFVLSRAFDNTTSLNIGGHGPFPNLKFQIFWGDRPPSSPRSPLLTATVCWHQILVFIL